MSILRVCDWCGRNIEDGTSWATIEANFARFADRGSGGYLGHYHCGDGHDCYRAVTDVLDMAHEFAESVGRIPVATGQRIGQLRRKHRKPSDQEDRR